MTTRSLDLLRIRHCPTLDRATMVLAFTGWMDGGDVSTGTVRRLIGLLDAPLIADIDPDPFYLFNFPGPMEVAALFRPALKIEDGLITSLEMPANVFHCHAAGNLVLFLGREPNLRWPTFADCVLELAQRAGARRLLFVGSFGGSVPHSREPRLHITCSDAALFPEMERYGLRRSGYSGPGSFASYLMTRAAAAGLEMVSLAAEVPSYLQGRNPVCIEAVTRRLAKVLRIPLELSELRAESTAWELEVSKAVEEDDDLAQKVRHLEEAYDEQLLREEDSGQA
jgi:hypothetical protein